jgi:cytochrome c
MVKVRALVGMVAMAAMVSACSGASDSKDGEKKAEAPAAAPAPVAAPAAPAAPAGAPAVTDVATLDGTTFAAMTGTAAAGKLVFAQCRTCHVTDAGVNKTGPSLHQIIGRKAGSVAGFSYTPANSGSGITWTKEKLFQYLEKPQRVIPKTKMIFAGLPDAQKRADLIAYLENPI